MEKAVEVLDQLLNLVTRSIPVQPNTYEEKTRSVEAAIASEAPVVVWDPERWEVVREILFMDGMQAPEDGQAPLIDTHNRSTIFKQLGSVRDFKKVGTQQVGRMYFDSTEEGQKAETKVREGHLKTVSAGYYRIESYWVPAGETRNFGGKDFVGPIRVTLRWSLAEVSLTIIPADRSATTRSLLMNSEIRAELVKRGLKENASEQEAVTFLQQELTKQSTIQRGAHMEKPGTTQTGEPMPVDVKAVERKARETERLRIEEFTAIETRFAAQVPNFKDLKSKALTEEWPAERFAHEVLKSIPGSRSVEVPVDDGSGEAGKVGLTKKEKAQYSIVRAIKQIGLHGSLDGLEKEISDEVAKRTGQKPDGFFIAPDIMAERGPGTLPPEVRQEIEAMLIRAGISTRALNVTEASKGGYLVGTEVMTASMIELLRNRPLVAQMGARRLAGLVGNVAIPKQSGGATAYWLPESGEVTGSDQSFGQLILTPHRLSADTVYQKELVNQTSLDVESFVREDLMNVLIIEKDRAAINGLGAAGEPLGIMNLTGLNTVTFGAAPTWAKYVDFWKEVATDNAALGQLGYLTTPAAAAKAMITPKFTNTGIPIWEAGKVMGSGSIGGYRAEATNQVPSDKVIFANWADLILADWSIVDVVVDPYSLKKKGQVEITVHVWTDLGARHAVSFCVSTDSGAQ